MKKGYFLKSTLSVFVLSVFVACDKKEVKKPEPQIVNTEIRKGLPENPRKINGYLYAGNSIYSGGGSPYGQVFITALFGDPARDFLSAFDHQNEQMVFFGGDNSANISVGALNYNDNLVGGGTNNTFYSRTFTLYNQITQDAHWVSAGNKSFLPMDVVVPGGFPVINPEAVSSHSVISKSQDLVLNFSNFISNCDSVAVTFGGQGSAWYLRKSVKYSDGQIRFTKDEISELSAAYSITVQYAGFNYSNKTINNKVFVFELSSRIRLYTTFTN